MSDLESAGSPGRERGKQQVYRKMQELNSFHSLVSGRQHANYKDDPSNKIWAVYVTEAWLQDKRLVESWKSDMDGILIFVSISTYIHRNIDRDVIYRLVSSPLA